MAALNSNSVLCPDQALSPWFSALNQRTTAHLKAPTKLLLVQLYLYRSLFSHMTLLNFEIFNPRRLFFFFIPASYYQHPSKKWNIINLVPETHQQDTSKLQSLPARVFCHWYQTRVFLLNTRTLRWLRFEVLTQTLFWCNFYASARQEKIIHTKILFLSSSTNGRIC